MKFIRGSFNNGREYSKTKMHITCINKLLQSTLVRDQSNLDTKHDVYIQICRITLLAKMTPETYVL